MTTILKVTSASQREAARSALRGAGLPVVEIENWSEAADAMQKDGDCLLLCDATAVGELSTRNAPASSLGREASRALSHELRTPLSAMAGWIHLLETGKLDEAGVKKVIAKLRGNIDDQVRTIERYLGTTSNQGKAT